MRNPRFLVLFFTAVLGILFTSACGGGSSPSTVTVPPPSVVVTLGNLSCFSAATPCALGVGANWQFSATLSGSGSAGQTVTWSISPSGASSGTIDSATGFYVAPNAVPASPVTVTATASSGEGSASISIPIQASDPIGSVVSSSQLSSCSGSVQNGNCYQLNVSCPLVADFSVYLKVNNPTGKPTGTVLLGVGTGGSGLYDDPTAGGYQYGSNVVNSLLSSGYNTVQVSFGAPFDSGTQPNGWLTGPGGVRHLACRYATVADWVYHNPSIINSGVSATTSAPMCATGNSGGSAAVAYAAYEFGLATGSTPELVMIEPTSGPVMSRIDQGCSSTCASLTAPVCSGSSNVASMCYESADAGVIDEAYQTSGATTPTPCSDSLAGNPGADAAAMFLSDSILFQPNQTISFPNTIVKQLFGDSDTSNAVPEGLTWSAAVIPSSSSPNPIYQCLASPVAHDIPSFLQGATQIATDIEAGCQ